MLLVYFIRLEHYVAFNFGAVAAGLRDLEAPAQYRVARGRRVHAVVRHRYGDLRQPCDSSARRASGRSGRLPLGQSIFLPAMAVAFAVSPIAGQNFGAKLAEAVRETFQSALDRHRHHGGADAALSVEPEWLIRPFSKDPAVVAVGAHYLHIASWNFVCNGIIFACSGLFQGLGNTWPALLSSGMRIFTFVLPAIWMAQQPWVKIEDFWYVSVASITLQAVISLLLLAQRDAQATRVRLRRRVNPAYSFLRIASCVGASMPILMRRPVPPSSVI